MCSSNSAEIDVKNFPTLLSLYQKTHAYNRKMLKHSLKLWRSIPPICRQFNSCSKITSSSKSQFPPALFVPQPLRGTEKRKIESLDLLSSASLPQIQPILPDINRGQKEIQDVPVINRLIENPRDSLLHEIIDIVKNDLTIEAPQTPRNKVDEIQAVRLIVIRKRKMKKHKLKKLRKKMKFDWAKVRQRREMRKEKAFQAQLIAQIKEAEAFSAEEYVSLKLKQLNETPLPRLWKGKRLPAFIIKELIEKEKIKKQEREYMKPL